MRIILQFCLIAIFLEGVFPRSYYRPSGHYECVHFEIWDLNIPNNNPIIKAEKNDPSDIWYTHINWLDNPAGDLSLLFRVQYWDAGGWIDGVSGLIGVYETGSSEAYHWAKLARKALGLNHPHVKMPSKVRVSQNLFPRNKCIWMNFSTDWNSLLKHRIFLDVTDDDGNLYLTGQIITPPQ